MEVKIKIARDGKVELDVYGAVGNECELTTALEQSLGVLEQKIYKPEYEQVTQAQQHVNYPTPTV